MSPGAQAKLKSSLTSSFPLWLSSPCPLTCHQSVPKEESKQGQRYSPEGVQRGCLPSDWHAAEAATNSASGIKFHPRMTKQGSGRVSTLWKPGGRLQVVLSSLSRGQENQPGDGRGIVVCNKNHRGEPAAQLPGPSPDHHCTLD